jgi:ATP-binding cassette subfamily B (MDR/TAP) protein 1
LESVSEEDGRGEFRKMMEQQSQTGGFLPAKDVAVAAAVDVESVLMRQKEKLDEKYASPAHLKSKSLAFRPLTPGNRMFNVIADLTSTKPATPTSTPPSSIAANSPAQRIGRRLSIQIPSTPVPDSQFGFPTPPPARPQSLQFTPTSPVFSFNLEKESIIDDEDVWKEKDVVRRSGIKARAGRYSVRPRPQTIALSPQAVNLNIETSSPEAAENEPPPPSFWFLMHSIYPTVPNKPILFLGLLFCLLNGSMTPVFSFLLSRLLFEVSSGARDVSTINQYGGLVLGVAALDGVFLGLKYYVMEYCGMSWVTNLRSIAIRKILKQDKKWFDLQRHSPSDIVQVVVKDGDDARYLVAAVWGHF